MTTRTNSPSESEGEGAGPSASPAAVSVRGSTPGRQRRYPGVEQIQYKARDGSHRLSRTYFIRYRYRGKQVREKTGLTDPRAAYEVLVKRLEEIRTGRLIGRKAETVMLAQLEQLVVDDYANRERATLPAVKRRYRYLGEWLGDAKMLHVTLADLNGYVRHRREAGAAPGTIGLELSALRRGYQLAVLSRLLHEVPTFPVIRVDNARRVFIERPVMKALMDYMPPHLRPVVEVALLTGWRREAILGLEWRHVNGGWLTLESPEAKNRKPLTIPLVGDLADIFARNADLAREIGQRLGRVIPWCFFYPYDVPPNVRAGQRIADFDNQWRLATRAAGMAHLRFHDLRRGAIRTLRRAGNSEHEIMEWVGLKTREVFDRYDIVDDERKQDTARRQQEYYEKQAGEAPKVAPIKTGSGRP